MCDAESWSQIFWSVAGSAHERIPLSSASYCDPSQLELALDVLVPIDAQLRVVREVGAELQQERPEVTIHGVEVVLIHHGRRTVQPGVRGSRRRIPSPLRPEDRGLLLRLAYEEQALIASEACPVLRRDVVLALLPLEADDVELLGAGEVFQCPHESLGHRRHQRRRGEPIPPTLAKEPGNPSLGLQDRDHRIQVHAIDPLDLQRHVVTQDLGNAPW